jgi:hypothetical protein
MARLSLMISWTGFDEPTICESGKGCQFLAAPDPNGSHGWRLGCLDELMGYLIVSKKRPEKDL